MPLSECVAPVTLRIKAPMDKVWRVVGERWGDVHRVLPSLSASRLVTEGDPGPGARRVCTLAEPLMGIETVEEKVTAWKNHQSFTYVFDAPPWPMASVSNTWALQADGEEARLTLTPSLRMRGGTWTQWLAPALLWAMSRSLLDDIPAMIQAIERECGRRS